MMTSVYSYPTNLNIQYSDNTEYRKCLRNIFKMNANNYPDTTSMDLDDETEDEMKYDYESASRTLDYVMENTINYPEIISLYEKAGSYMFSTDPNIGLTILFGYDYLDLFHSLLKTIFMNKNITNISDIDEYKKLHDKIFNK